MFKATINRETLTDNSHVYRVDFTDGGERVAEFDAITENDAMALAHKVTKALQDHALIEVTNVTEYDY